MRYATEIPAQLWSAQEALQQLDPLAASSQAIEFRESHWSRYLPADADLQVLCQSFPGALTRGDLAGLASMARKESSPASARRLFVGSMLWGYGTVGYGPYRTAKMLACSDSLDMLHATLILLQDGRTAAAYERFRLPMCGPAFFTKFFYFVGLGCDSAHAPLILDSVVANALESELRVDIRRLARVTRDGSGRVSAVGRDADGYMRYLELLHTWADQLQCRPDSIELFLFTWQAASGA